MTPGSPRPKAERRRRELIILAAVMVFFVVIAVFTPQRPLNDDARASAFSAEALGARAFYELADRLGWQVSRIVSDSIVPDENEIVVVLDPPLEFRATEVHTLLEGVRQGGALLYAMRDETLNDSLHVWVAPPGYELRPDSMEPPGPSCNVPRQFSDRVITSFQGRNLFLLAVEDSGAIRGPVDTLLRVLRERDTTAARVRPAVIGFPLGRGRVVVAADVDLLRNDNVRVCAWDAAVQAVRMLEYLSDGSGVRRTRVVFDEYHQGRGARPGTTRAIALYLRTTSSGKALAHLGVAGVVLLLALSPRALPPRDAERIERRSPLEHVDALSRAYWQVHATQTATRRLLRGVRRRTEHRFGGAQRTVSDDAFLDWIDERIQARHHDVDLVQHALTAPMPRQEFARVGAALRRLEHDLLTFRS